MLYSLVALGFIAHLQGVGVFNFAQGAMVYLAALSWWAAWSNGAPSGWPSSWPSSSTLFGIATENSSCASWSNQPRSPLFMATIGWPWSSRQLAPMRAWQRAR